jgi:hypothetical protein
MNLLFKGRPFGKAKLHLVYNLSSACLIEIVRFGDLEKRFNIKSQSEQAYVTHKIDKEYDLDGHVMFIHAMYGEFEEQKRIIVALMRDSNAFGVFSRILALTSDKRWFQQAMLHGFLRSNDMKASNYVSIITPFTYQEWF